MPRYTLHDEANAVSYPVMSLARIALHVLTDFRPWAPPGTHLGLVPFLASMVSRSQFRWETHRDLEHYEKQWRPVISWLLASAFCREAIDGTGWSSALPVSVLSSSRATSGPWPAYLSAALGRLPVHVQRPARGLMPDYLAVPVGTGNFAFFEAKGGMHPTIASTTPGKMLAKDLAAWITQVGNARLVISGRPVAAERWIAATRVHPGAYSRELYVRLWKVPSPPLAPASGAAPGSDGGQNPAEPEATPEDRTHAIASLAAVSRALSLYQLRLDAAAEVVALAGERLGSRTQVNVDHNRRAATYSRGQEELAKLERVVVNGERVARIAVLDLGRGLPRLHVGLLSSGVEDLLALAHAAVEPSEEVAFRWRTRERTPVRDFEVEGAPGAARADGFVVWVEPR